MRQPTIILRGHHTMCAPDVVLEDPYEADPQFHKDRTQVRGSRWDYGKWEQEQNLRERRHLLIRESLEEGRSVFYKSTGDSMWPLVQSGDACTFYPIQAVTAKKGRCVTINKEESEIEVGDIVFCRVNPRWLFYAHIVLEKKPEALAEKTQYVIGNIKNHKNGWCWREHIFGILVDVQVWRDGQYCSRPLPRRHFQEVAALMAKKKERPRRPHL